MNLVLISILSLSIIGFAAGALLAYANIKFHREEDPRVEQIDEALPGANCGACGYPGCRGFAEAVVAGKVEPAGCLLGGNEIACQVAKIMGVEVGAVEKPVAILKCGGGKEQSPPKFDYDGVLTCQAANTTGGGFKACSYGCLGLGDCERVCPVNCIKINDNGLPEVDRPACIGCGKCVTACPRDLFILLPRSTEYHVNCSSQDKGPVVRKVCKVGCIGCTICVKKCPAKAIDFKDFVATIDQSKCDKKAECIKACPTKCIIKLP
ncbi:RnfABCDGE type electron transport complex subunit B [Candidatus Margulisiibacteriota bacterium]